jgi:DUF1365 family protein
MKSAIYSGWIRHRRRHDRAQFYRHRIFMCWLDLAELPGLFRGRQWWRREAPAPASFRRADYLGDPRVPLDQAGRDLVERRTGARPTGPIRLLTHLRYLGACFNPVSFYYCYAADGATLDTVVAEITNTPWKERHAYVLPVDRSTRRGIAYEWGFAKAFHVSPFLPMQRDYRWRFEAPGESLRVHMEVLKDGAPDFDATLVLEREPLDAAGLSRALWGFPLMTARVVAAIHWQALLIWLKRNPVYDHPSKSRG